ncbi:MAG: excisionase family DNA-binding protein [Candidatus Omnitrophica bacterium]|nr:excisionase family DNA-binding protein [Candidatus Omnitrophota bacterium]
MPTKLLTLQELSSYLGISEERIVSLVDEGVLSAYRLGGEFLRFRKEQVDAVHSEIKSRIKDTDRVSVSEARAKVQERHRMVFDQRGDSIRDRVADFFYFYDFYIISALLIGALLVIIFS